MSFLVEKAKSKSGSEERLILYLLFIVGLTIVTTLLSSIVLFIFWDCWPLERIGFSSCLGTLVPPAFHFLPMLLGLILGVLLAHGFIRNQKHEE